MEVMKRGGKRSGTCSNSMMGSLCLVDISMTFLSPYAPSSSTLGVYVAYEAILKDFICLFETVWC